MRKYMRAGFRALLSAPGIGFESTLHGVGEHLWSQVRVHNANLVHGRECCGQLRYNGLHLVYPGAREALAMQSLLQRARPLRVYNNKLILGQIVQVQQLLMQLAVLLFLLRKVIIVQYLDCVQFENFRSLKLTSVAPSQELQPR